MWPDFSKKTQAIQRKPVNGYITIRQFFGIIPVNKGTTVAWADVRRHFVLFLPCVYTHGRACRKGAPYDAQRQFGITQCSTICLLAKLGAGLELPHPHETRQGGTGRDVGAQLGNRNCQVNSKGNVLLLLNMYGTHSIQSSFQFKAYMHSARVWILGQFRAFNDSSVII